MSQSRKRALSSLQYAANGSLQSKNAQDTSQNKRGRPILVGRPFLLFAQRPALVNDPGVVGSSVC